MGKIANLASRKGGISEIVDEHYWITRPVSTTTFFDIWSKSG